MKALLLDLDDTLLDDRSASSLALSAFLNFHRHSFDSYSIVQMEERWRLISRKHWRAFERGEVSFSEQRRCRVRDFLDLDLDNIAADRAFEPYRQVYESSWTLLPGVEAFLQHTALLPKVIVTNGDREQQLRKILACGLESHIVGVVTPSDCGHWKPDTRIFIAALDMLGVNAAECLMVGDDLVRDIQPAQALGMQVVQVLPGGRFNSLLSTIDVV